MEERTRLGRARSFGSGWGRRLLRRSHVHSHPRLLGAMAVAIIVYFFLSGGTETATRFLLAFDGGALVFLAAIWVMMARATPDGMRRRAEIEDRTIHGFDPERRGRDRDSAHYRVRASWHQGSAPGLGRPPCRAGSRNDLAVWFFMNIM